MNKVKRIITIALALLVMGIFPASVTLAATTPSPYGFTYDDSVNGRTMYKFYQYDVTKKAHIEKRVNYSIGNSVYTNNGILICKNSAGSGSRYNGFASDGKFYMVTKNGELLLNASGYTTSVVIKSGAKNLNYNSDDLAISVATSDGTLRLSDLTKVPESDPGTTPQPTPKAKNRVEMYTNSANELVYASYKNNKIKTKIVVNGPKVLNETAKVRLSDTLYGAKFMGFDSSYNVYLREGTNTLYRFKDGKWYTAEKLTLSGSYKKFNTDANGFISEIVTSSGTYSIKTLTNSNKWKASKTYVVSKADYKTLYIKGKTTSHVLRLTSKKLYLDGKQIANGVSKYGFMSATKLIYIKSGKAYTATLSAPKTAKLYVKKASKLTNNSSGLVIKVS